AEPEPQPEPEPQRLRGRQRSLPLGARRGRLRHDDARPLPSGPTNTTRPGSWCASSDCWLKTCVEHELTVTEVRIRTCFTFRMGRYSTSTRYRRAPATSSRSESTASAAKRRDDRNRPALQRRHLRLPSLRAFDVKITQVDGNHQQVANGFGSRAPHESSTFRGKTKSVGLDDVVHVLRGWSPTRNLQPIVMAAQ